MAGKLLSATSPAGPARVFVGTSATCWSCPEVTVAFRTAGYTVRPEEDQQPPVPVQPDRIERANRRDRRDPHPQAVALDTIQSISAGGNRRGGRGTGPRPRPADRLRRSAHRRP